MGVVDGTKIANAVAPLFGASCDGWEPRDNRSQILVLVNDLTKIQKQAIFSEMTQINERRASPAKGGAVNNETGSGITGGYGKTRVGSGKQHLLVSSSSTQSNQKVGGCELDTHEYAQGDVDDFEYYRIIYRGVVALLAEPSLKSGRSGSYVSFGDIIATRKGNVVNDIMEGNDTSTEERHSPKFAPPLDGRGPIVQVDSVLTGGYAVDAMENTTDAWSHTPKRTNTQLHSPTTGPTPLPIQSGDHKGQSSSGTSRFPNNANACHGYILSATKSSRILQSIEDPPALHQGNFLYQVVSSTPLPILTGPSLDAPRTRTMIIPGTVHEVCLRLYGTGQQGTFLRLTRRRGWVVDRQLANAASNRGRVLFTMKDVTKESTRLANGARLGSSFDPVATPVTGASCRHRPPRRNREFEQDSSEIIALPTHVSGTFESSAAHSRQSHNTDMGESSAPKTTQERSVLSPSSNISMLSDESSSEPPLKPAANLTPDRSVARGAASVSSSAQTYFLIRVTAPTGLKILDAPHFQVNNLIHGSHSGGSGFSSYRAPKDTTQNANQSIFQTMGGHQSTTIASSCGNPVIYDSISKSRRLPRGSVFEASKRMETSGAFSQGAGLIKLSDGSGWAIIPRQEDLDEQHRNHTGSVVSVRQGKVPRAFEEVGNAVVDDQRAPVYYRVLAKEGVQVSLPPASSSAMFLEDASPASSAASLVISDSGGFGQAMSQDSDVSSSVSSSFLDAMFRTPKKRYGDEHTVDSRRQSAAHRQVKPPGQDKLRFSALIPCGSCVEVEHWAETPEQALQPYRGEFARIRGGQGWIPRVINGRKLVERITQPEHRTGSFWFRVQTQRGIKARQGPSKRSLSIKSDQGAYFRFECGEFLRSSEVVTFFHDGSPAEGFARLYRNRHVRLNSGHRVKSLASLTVQSEWVQVFGDGELYLEECASDPRIERHRQGWRYNVVLDARIHVRKGPSFRAEANGVVLLGGESVLINERVNAPDDTITWLRLKDGQGWVHNVGPEGEALMIPHSLRHRNQMLGRPSKAPQEAQSDIAYNAIVARLFHSEIQDDEAPSQRPKSKT